MRNKLQKQHRENDFNARLQMERQAQREVRARLDSLEIIADNQARRKRHS